MRWLLLIALVGGCGTTSTTGKVAAAAGLAAAAVTTAMDPDYAKRAEEDNRIESMDGKPVSRTVPVQVFDRLDDVPLDP